MSLRVRVLLAVCAGLAAWALATRPAAPPALALGALPAFAEIDRMTIGGAGRAPLELRLRAGVWRAGEAPADAHAIEAVRSALEAPVVLEPTGSGDLETYALTAGIEIRFGCGGRDFGGWRLGKVVDGRHTFVLPLEGGTVYRARANLRRAFDRPAAGWRERRLFPGRGPADIRALTMRRGPDVEWQATRATADSPWVLEIPAGLRPGQQELHSVANTLATSSATGFEEAPELRSLHELDGETFDGGRLALALGPRAKDGSGLVRRGDGVVARLPNHQLTFLDVRAAELRERRVFDFSAAEVLAISTSTGVRLSKRGEWRMEAPRRAAVHEETARLYLQAIAGLRAAGFPERPPADAVEPVFAQLDVQLTEDRLVSLQLGKPYGGSARYARTTDRPDGVFALPAGTVERLLPSPESLLAPPRLEFR